MHTNTSTHMLVTIAKTPLNDTQIPSPMETIKIILQVAIELLIITFFIPIIAHDLRILFQVEKDLRDPQK